MEAYVILRRQSTIAGGRDVSQTAHVIESRLKSNNSFIFVESEAEKSSSRLFTCRKSVQDSFAFAHEAQDHYLQGFNMRQYLITYEVSKNTVSYALQLYTGRPWESVDDD